MIYTVGEGKEKTFIKAETFNSASTSGWQILIFFEMILTTGTIFKRNTKLPLNE